MRGQVASESQCLCRLDPVKLWPSAPYNHRHISTQPRSYCPTFFFWRSNTLRLTLTRSPLRSLPQAGKPVLFMSAVGEEKKKKKKLPRKLGAGPGVQADFEILG